MGAWDELNTEISVENDFTDLDNLLSLDDELGIFEPVHKIVDDLKSAIDEGSQRGVFELAKRNISFQEKWINQNCKNPSGILATSIDYEEEGDYSFITGTRINDIYPMSVEYGRSEVYPITAKALAFYADSGELLFRKWVRKAEPRPFVAPAYDDTVEITETIMVDEIAHAGVQWD